jgi:hypothetical protein
MDKLLKVIENASEEELNELMNTIKARQDELSRDRAADIRIGMNVKFGNDLVGRVVLIDESGVIVSSESLKKRKTLKWSEIQGIVD